jgi:uncharacterized membrane protein YdcZ (DUF606 family)
MVNDYASLIKRPSTSMFTSILLVLVCTLVGSLSVLQSAVNYELSVALGGQSLYAVFVSMLVAFLTIL